MPVGEIDQSNTTIGSSPPVAPAGQTFTAGVTGQLTTVSLYSAYVEPLVVGSNGAIPNSGGAVTVNIYATAGGLPTGGSLASALNGGTGPGWFDFTLSAPVPVTSGTMYAIVFTVTSGSAYYAGAYSRGTALTFSGSAWSKDTGNDFAFRTYVYHQFTQVAWSQGQVLGGASTNMNLLETFTLPGGEPGAVGTAWRLSLAGLPAWFTETGVSCSANVTDCVLSNVEGNMHTTADQTSAWIRIYGTASPQVSDIGTSGTGSASGCLVPSGLDGQPMFCVFGSADVAVVSVITTPPPGTTSGEPVRSGGSGAWLLPGAIVALLGVAFALNRRRLLER
jgi:hypothetical protein